MKIVFALALSDFMRKVMMSDSSLHHFRVSEHSNESLLEWFLHESLVYPTDPVTVIFIGHESH